MVGDWYFCANLVRIDGAIHMNLNYVKKLETQKRMLAEMYDDFDDLRYCYVVGKIHDDFVDFVSDIFVEKKVLIHYAGKKLDGIISRITYSFNNMVFIVYTSERSAHALKFDDIEILE